MTSVVALYLMFKVHGTFMTHFIPNLCLYYNCVPPGKIHGPGRKVVFLPELQEPRNKRSLFPSMVFCLHVKSNGLKAKGTFPGIPNNVTSLPGGALGRWLPRRAWGCLPGAPATSALHTEFKHKQDQIKSVSFYYHRKLIMQTQR